MPERRFPPPWSIDEAHQVRSRVALGEIFDPALGNCSGICPSEFADGVGHFWGLQLRGRRSPGGGIVEADQNHLPSWTGLRC